MNYFLTKRQSRLLTIALATCLCATMFTGCQKIKPEDTVPSTEEEPPIGLVDVIPTEETTVPTEATDPVNENMAITIDEVDVRSSPSAGAKRLGTLDPDTEIEIIKTETYMGKKWALIREGWIEMAKVEMINGSSIPEETTPEETKPAETQPGNTTKITGTVTSNGLFIRPEPSTAGEPKGSYPKGATITILETKNGWGRTDKGWVSMQHVKTNGNTNTGSTNNNNNNNNNTTTGGDTYFVTVDLNIRDAAGTHGNRVGGYTPGDKVTVTETSNGWGKTDKGWVSMQYLYKTGTTGTNTTSGIVIGEGLNIRSGPGTGYNSAGSYGYGARVNILEQIGNWGCTDKGWISLGYVYIDGDEGENSGSGTITGDNVNVRSGPGTQYNSVGTMNTGDLVKVFEQFTFDDVTWGCIGKGKWVCMDYVGVG